MTFLTRCPGLFRTLVALAGLLLIGSIILDPAFAEPKQVTSSMAYRIQADKQLCEPPLGEGKLTASSGFTNGRPSVTTVCSGGVHNGRTCVHTRDTMDCKTVKQLTHPVNVENLPLITVANDDVVVQATPDAGLPNGGIEVTDSNPPVDTNNVEVDGPELEAIDPTAGQPPSGPVLEWTPIENPNGVTDDDLTVVPFVTPTQTPAP